MRLYTYRWLSLLVWLYFAEGVVRATQRRAASSARSPRVEVALCLRAVRRLLRCTCAARLRARRTRRALPRARAP